MLTEPVRSALAAFLTLLLAAPAAPAQETPAPSKLNLVIVEGDGAINNVRQRVTREPVVQVEDENRKPVAGAAVTFLLPNQGASGVFADGSRMLTVMTDENGRAVARGLKMNNNPGQMEIRVTASKSGLSTSGTITMTSVAAAAAAGISTGLLVTILAIAGGAAAGIAVGVTRNGDSTPPPPGPQPPAPTVLTPGAPTVGPPR